MTQKTDKKLLTCDIDQEAARQHFQTLDELAARTGISDAQLVLASYGQKPCGTSLQPLVKNFPIGDVDAMVSAATMLSAQNHRNIYSPLAIYRYLKPGRKGSESDIVSVLGLVADFDDANASSWPDRCPVEPQYVLRTSAERFQAFFFFDRALTVAEAKPIAEGLKEYCNCDHGTSDCSHIWRIPGLLNWPNRKKIDSGRFSEPQLVTVVQPWDSESFANVDELRTAVENVKLSKIKKAPRKKKASPGFVPPKEEKKVVNIELPDGLVDSLCSDDFRNFTPIWYEKKKLDDSSPSGFDAAMAQYAISNDLVDHLPGLVYKRRKARGHDYQKATRADYIQGLKDSAEEYRSRLENVPPAVDKSTGLPVIRLNQQQESQVVADSVAAFKARNDSSPSVFLYNGIPVSVSVVGDSLKMEEVSSIHMRNLLSKSAVFKSYKYKKWSDSFLPDKLAALVLDEIKPALPGLKFSTNVPVVLADGTIHQKPGYDPATHIFYHPPANLNLPVLKEKPTPEDAKRSTQWLYWNLISDFPFVSDEYVTNFFAALLSPFCFDYCGKPPGFAITATERGSGKSKLVDIISLIFSGKEIPAFDAPESDQEFRKVLLPLFIEGRNLVSFDNLERPLRSSALSICLTQKIFAGRILGFTRLGDCRTDHMQFFATGNHIDIVGDLTRRFVWLKLESEFARPYLRDKFYHNDLLRWVKDNRSEIICNILTVIRSGIISETVPNNPMPGNFRAWSRKMGKILRTAGLNDFLASFASDQAAADSDACHWADFLSCCYEKYATEDGTFLPLTVREIIFPADTFDMDLFEMLPATLKDLFDHKDPDRFPQKLGHAFKKIRNRRFVIDNQRQLFLEEAGKHPHSKVQRWRIMEAS